ncbi:site-specific integrase [Domibacillus antri]|uniref:Site-specific integrase n=1 Tax=Domibacillus antri TaxID=1714264 RepID=A0A1Q8Q9C8_9BACI|nr:site-specific integrase [Domibacillus antri]OLN23865.1 site-specific integrase [Domibacillus antri]
MASIEKRGGNSFRLVVEAGYDNHGKRKKRSKTIRVDPDLLKKTRKLNDFLNAELYKFKTEVESGEYIAPEKLTIAAFSEEWEKKYAKKELGEQTLDTYRSYLKNHILPAFGHMRLDQVKPIHVVNFLDGLKRADGDDKGLSISTNEYIYRVLRNVFQRAEDWKILKENPVASVKRPKDRSKKKVVVYDEKEIAVLFAAAQGEPIYWRVFITLALAAGLRRGELLGLEWKHIDFDKSTLHIEQVISRGEKGRPVLKEPKSETSKRLISLPSSVLLELKRYQLHWRKEKMKMGELWIETEHEYVFCNENGKHFYPTTPTTWWKRFTTRADVRYIRLHDLRHTSATLLINQGVHAKIISERLGHADIRITMDTYGHALRSADQEAADKLNDLFSPKKDSI